MVKLHVIFEIKLFSSLKLPPEAWPEPGHQHININIKITLIEQSHQDTLIKQSDHESIILKLFLQPFYCSNKIGYLFLKLFQCIRPVNDLANLILVAYCLESRFHHRYGVHLDLEPLLKLRMSEISATAKGAFYDVS